MSILDLLRERSEEEIINITRENKKPQFRVLRLSLQEMAAVINQSDEMDDEYSKLENRSRVKRR